MTFCTNCGSVLSGGTAFCTACGATAESAPRARWSTGARLSVVSLAVVLAGGGAWLAVSPDSPLRADEPTTTVEEVVDTDDDPAALDVLGSGSPPSVVAGSFDLGPVEELGSGTVEAEGGSIVSPDGLIIEVPEGAHDETATYTLSKAGVHSSSQALGHRCPSMGRFA